MFFWLAFKFILEKRITNKIDQKHGLFTELGNSNNNKLCGIIQPFIVRTFWLFCFWCGLVRGKTLEFQHLKQISFGTGIAA